MKRKRYFQVNNGTIIDKAGDEKNWIYYYFDGSQITFYCENKEVKFHQDKVIGQEALTFWDDLLDRVNNKKNYYYWV